MHVKPGAPLNDHLHSRLHPKEGDRDAAGIVETLPRVLPVPGGDKKWYLNAARAGLLIGVASHRRLVSLNTIARGETRTNRPAPPPFSPLVARQRRWLAGRGLSLRRRRRKRILICILAVPGLLSDTLRLARVVPSNHQNHLTKTGVKQWILGSKAAAPSSAHRARDWDAPVQWRWPMKACTSP